MIMKEIKGENNAFYGKKHSEESKRKMSESHKKRRLAACQENTL